MGSYSFDWEEWRKKKLSKDDSKKDDKKGKDSYCSYLKSWKKTEYKRSFDIDLESNVWDTYNSYSKYKSYYHTSEYKGENENQKDIKKAFSLCSDLITVLDLPYKVKLEAILGSVDMNPGTKIIFVPTEVFDNLKYDSREKINITCGLGLHAVSFLNNTNFSEYSKYLLKMIHEKKSSVSELFTFKKLSKLIESERVEDITLSERPGLQKHIMEVRKYELDSLEGSKSLRELEVSHSIVPKFLKKLIGFIRYPELLEDSDIDEFGEYFEKVRDVLKDKPKTTDDSCEISSEILDIIKKFVEDYTQMFFPVDNIKVKEQILGSIGKALKDLVKSDIHEGKDCCDTSPDAFSDYRERQSSDIEEGSIFSKILNDSAEYGSDEKTYFERSKKEVKSTYEKSRYKIQPLVPAIRKILKDSSKNFDFNVHGCRSGLLDTPKIAEAYQGVSQVYVRKGKVTTSKTNLCILIDESGSMCNEEYYDGKEGKYYRRSDIARDAAILLNESFGKIPGIDLYIYGHTADEESSGIVHLITYKEKGKEISKYSLGDIQPRRENRDHKAIDEVCARVRKLTSDNVIMFVISDGVPAAEYYGGEYAMNQVREVVNKWERNNFTIIQVNIGRSLLESQMKRMFNNYVFISGGLTSDFPKQLASIVKKAVCNSMKSNTDIF